MLTNAGRQTLARTLPMAGLCVPVVCGLFLIVPSATLPGDSMGIRRFQTPSLGPDLRLGQTFRMPVDGLWAIAVFPERVGRQAAGDVLFELYEVGEGGGTRVRSMEVPAEDLLRAPSYEFRFAPILDSRDRTYRLDLVASPGEGVGFWATKGERYAAGRMHVNGRDRWADLSFEARAPVPSLWQVFVILHARRPAMAYAAAVALTGLSFLVPLVLQALMQIRPHPDESSDAD